MEFLNLRRDSVLVLVGAVDERKKDSKALKQLQNLLSQMTGWAEIVVARPSSTTNAQEYLRRHFSNRNCCAFLRVFYIGHLDPETGDCVFPGEGRLSASDIREAYASRKYKPQLEVNIIGPHHAAWEEKESDGPTMKVFFTKEDDLARLEDGINILLQEGFKFEHFVHAVWPTASIVRWRWEKSCKGAQKFQRKVEEQEADNNNAVVFGAAAVGLVLLLAWYHNKSNN